MKKAMSLFIAFVTLLSIMVFPAHALTTEVDSNSNEQCEIEYGVAAEKMADNVQYTDFDEQLASANLSINTTYDVGDHTYIEHESNDTPRTAGILYDDNTIHAAIYGYDMDWHVFTLPHRSLVSIVAVGDYKGLIFGIFDSNGDECLVAGDAVDRGDYYGGSIAYELPAGSYTLLFLSDYGYYIDYTFYFDYTIKTAVTGHPENVTVEDGTEAYFAVSAVGEGLRYQWQYRTSSSESWATLYGCTAATLNLTGTQINNGYQYRCAVTGDYGSTDYSNAATLTVEQAKVAAPSITTQPKNITADEGDSVRFTVVAEGEELTYQWQYRTSKAGTWKNLGNKTATLKVAAAEKRNGWQYRCVVTNSGGSVNTRAATLTVVSVPEVTIITQPVSMSVEEGAKAVFKVVAEGEELAYQWQYRTSKTGTWKNLSNKTTKLSVAGMAKRNGWQYQCVITDANGNAIISDVVTLTVKVMPKITITTQPTNVTVDEDDKAKFTVVAEGEDLTYQWQYRKDSNADWKNLSCKAAKLTVAGKASRDGWQYRCIVTDRNGTTVTSNEVTLSVNVTIPITIIAQPNNASVVLGQKATFVVVAEGEGLTYQWQYCKKNGGKWSDNNCTDAVFSVKATETRNGYQYRCIITNDSGETVTSNVATLLIK